MVPCAYAVDRDGFVEIAVVGIAPDGTPSPFSDFGIIVDDHAVTGEFFVLITDPNGQTVGSGVFKKQNP